MARRLTAVLGLGSLVASSATIIGLPAQAGISEPLKPTALEISADLSGDVNLAGPGLIPATVLGTDALSVAEIDAATVTLGDGSPADTPVAQHAGDALASVVDANADDRDDLTLLFDKEELIAQGELTATTTELTLSGSLRDGQAIRASHEVSPRITLEVKFDEALKIRGSDQSLRGTRGQSLERIRALLDRHQATDLSPLVQGVPPERMDRVAADARSRSGRPVPDMASWYSLTLPADVDVDEALRELEALPEVDYAYPAPEPAPPPQASTTPDFTGRQGYFRPAPEGIDADFSRQDPRVRGAGIKIVDLEYDWNPFHEDLQLDWSSDLGGEVFPRNTFFMDEHGTAVFGELVAVDNDYGVTGGVPDAEMFGISPTQRLASGGTSWRPGSAMAYLAGLDFLEPGDALLIEQQTVGPNGGTNYVPVEWIQSAFDATVLLTSMGVNVIYTGGNGNQDLDGPEYLGRFDRDVRDSGSIIVGAGSSTDHSRLGFSVYGSRVDLQGWGHNITTTGSNGNLQGGTDPANVNIRYTRSFGGTSGAGPIVTSAVAAIQSYVKATGQEPWSAARIADVLKATGTSQGGDTSQHIGPLPNLEAALKQIEVDAPTTTALLDGRPVRSGPYRDPVLSLEADDGWGSGVDRIAYRLDGSGPWITYEGPIAVIGSGDRTVEYRSNDLNGNTEIIQSLTFTNRVAAAA
jgi:hypothetical protein